MLKQQALGAPYLHGKGMAELHLCMAPENPSPEIALCSIKQLILQHESPLEGLSLTFVVLWVLLLLSMKSRSLRPACCGGRWHLGMHLFLEGKNEHPTYDLIYTLTLQCGCGRDAELLMPDPSN